MSLTTTLFEFNEIPTHGFINSTHHEYHAYLLDFENDENDERNENFFKALR